MTSISPISVGDAPSQGISIARSAGQAEAGRPVRISFTTDTESAAPMSKIGGGILERLRDFEATRAEHRKAMQGVAPGPASAIEAEKAKLMAGPASIRPATTGVAAEPPAAKAGFQDAVTAMTRSFDYAIETQLVVKTGSQLSTSASSLMRGQ